MADSTERMTRFSSYAVTPDLTDPAERTRINIGWVARGFDVAAALRDANVFQGLCEADAVKVSDIVTETAFRFWRYHRPGIPGGIDDDWRDDPDPEFNLVLANRAACAVGRLDGGDWINPELASRALSRAADALQPNITVVDLGMARET
jgi:hypothetical protein